MYDISTLRTPIDRRIRSGMHMQTGSRMTLSARARAALVRRALPFTRNKRHGAVCKTSSNVLMNVMVLRERALQRTRRVRMILYTPFQSQCHGTQKYSRSSSTAAVSSQS